MSEDTGVTSTTEEADSQEPTFAAITSQEEFDKAIQARIARERAKFPNYDQLQADSAELGKIRESQKTEAQKAQDELDQAKRELADERLARTRAEVAAEKGIPANLLTGSTREELEASAEALIQFRGEQGTQRTPRPDPNQGKPAGTALTNGDQFAAFFETQLGG